MVYVLIVSIVAAILVSILAIRPTARERLAAYIRNQAIIQSWAVRFVEEKELITIYKHPLQEQVVCYFKHRNEAARQTPFNPWVFYNDTDGEGVLGKKYLCHFENSGDYENKEVPAQILKTIDMLFQSYGEVVYGIKVNQSGVFCYWNEKINKTEIDKFLNILTQILGQ